MAVKKKRQYKYNHLVWLAPFIFIFFLLFILKTYLKPVFTHTSTETHISKSRVPDSITYPMDERKTSVVTVPLKTLGLQKDVAMLDRCNNPIGLVTYYDRAAKTYMKINSTLDTQTNTSEESMPEVESYISHSLSLRPYQNIISWELAFRNYCGGHSYLYIREIEGVTYPGTDTSRAMMVYTTQEPLGDVSVVIFAKKGDDVIQLSKFIKDKSLYAMLESACKINPDDYEKSEECYRNKLLNDGNVYTTARDQANELISQYALN